MGFGVFGGFLGFLGLAFGCVCDCFATFDDLVVLSGGFVLVLMIWCKCGIWLRDGLLVGLYFG